ncbi:MAG TPA: fructose-6-phosphate aldolase [Bacillota bacterium]|nr:fructose-6-phosphate aldolase [Bacillota bacterium]
MRLFIDTASPKEIEEAMRWGVVSGVTTNPTLVARERFPDFHAAVRSIATMVDGPVNAEVIALEREAMVEEARELAGLAPNVVVKIPLTPDGLAAVRQLAREKIATNVTLVFSAAQSLLAALAGAGYASVFVGRLDDAGHEGMEVVRQTTAIFDRHGMETAVIAASIRHPLHVVEAALAGADIATVPFAVLRQLLRHPLTDLGIERFLADWRQVSGNR